MSAFDMSSPVPVYGRVLDLAGNTISNPATPMQVTFTQFYGAGCMLVNDFPVLLGFFDGNILKMSDNRNFQTKVKLNSGSEYLKIEQHLEYRSFIETNELFL